jgi:Uncharacterized conserved protein
VRPAAELEIERKYALRLDEEVPSLAGSVIEGPISSYQLVAAYYDSPDQRLRADRLVIRRRTGGRDDGWHLKAPGADSDHRLELQLPIDEATPGMIPQPFWDEVSQRLEDRPLIPIATVRTHRLEQDLLGADQTVLARLCIDEVHSVAGPRSDHWREAEIELAAGQPGLLDELEAILAEAGIVRATDVAKIARALGPGGDRGATNAGSVVQGYLAAQLGALQHWYRDPSGLAGGDTHDGRVSCRRLRSVLGTFAVVFAPGVKGRLRAELRWLGLQLSPVRDAQVVAARLAEGVAELAADSSQLADSYRALVADRRLAGLRTGLDRVRVAALLRGLEPLLDGPALSAVAERDASGPLVAAWHTAVATVRGQADAATRDHSDAGWHAVRKSAKAVRYGAELISAALPEFVAQAAAWERVTETLGAVQDAAVTRAELSSEVVAALPGATPQLLAALDGRESVRAAAALQDARTAVASALALS